MNEQHTPAPESTPINAAPLGGAEATPPNTVPTAHFTQSTAPAAGNIPVADRGRARPRTGPIIWGVIFLACCAWISQRVFFPDVVAPEIWITAIVLGIGLVLLAVGVSVLLRRR